MKCRNRFCVFNRVDECLNKDVHLNECGACEDFYYPTYLRGLSNKEKDKFLSTGNGMNDIVYRNENKKYRNKPGK